MIRLIDRLLHAPTAAQASADELRVLRVLAGVSAYLLLPTLGLAVSLYQSGGLLSALPCFVIELAVIGTLVRLKLTGQRRHSGTVLWFSLFVICVHSGAHEGALTSFLGPTACLVVMLAMYLENVIEGFIAAALTVTAMAALYWFHAKGHALPSLTPGQDTLPLTVVSAAMSTVALTFLAWANHASRQHAFNELAEALERVKASEAARERAEADLRLAQKLEAVGRLAAGMAHEINTPLQFAGDSVRFVSEALHDLLPVVAAYERVSQASETGSVAPALREELARAKEAADLDYVIPELPQAAGRALEGMGRVTQIVRSMKEFAHQDRKDRALSDLNRAIQSTLTIARGEYKDVADIELSLGDIPRVSCQLGEVNQVVLNLIVNAAHAIADKNRGTSRRGKISVKTARDGDDVLISVGDDGPGIPRSIQPLIYDPFFTTKEVGRGTGQGLAIARSVIVNQHGGSLTFDSVEGVGTTFYARLPTRAM